MKSKNLYLRTLKKVNHGVFCVDSDQKYYFDKVFGVKVPYSSGQQVKKSMLLTMVRELDLPISNVTMYFELDSKNVQKQKEVLSSCDPTYSDQLLGGWMSAKKGGENIFKRRSPLSISAMTALHPLLVNYFKELIIFDRTEIYGDKIVINNQEFETETEVIKFLEEKNAHISKRKSVGEKSRATGLYSQDVVIDLKRLFSVCVNSMEKEITEETKEELISNGWNEVTTPLGEILLVAPAETIKELTEALVYGLLNWQITSNQSRTLDFMPTLAVAISDKPNQVYNSIYAELDSEHERKAIPVVQKLSKSELFVQPIAKGFFNYSETSPEALDLAAEYLKNQIFEYYGVQ